MFSKEDIIIVTGASSGIGRGVALQLNELGATVVAIARNEERLKELKCNCKHPENLNIEIKDLTEDIANLPEYITNLKEKYGKFRGLAYCAGISKVIPVRMIDYDLTKKFFEINYYAPLFITKGVVDKRNNIGPGTSIVVISSISGIKADKGQAIYAGTKAGIAASMKSIGREVASKGIRVNCLSPSDIKTPLTADKEEMESPKYPLGFGEVEDVANMVTFLLSNKSKWITTQNYIVDCGYM